MNFMQAFSETIGKENPNPTPEINPNPASRVETTDLTSDMMKSYVDAKFESLKSDLLSEMQKLNTVETPKETPGTDAIIRPEEEKPGVDSTIENK